MIILFTIIIRINHNNHNNDQNSQKAGRKSEAKYGQHKRESCWKSRAKAEAPQKHCAKPPPPSPSTKRNPEIPVKSHPNLNKKPSQKFAKKSPIKSKKSPKKPLIIGKKAHHNEKKGPP